MALQKQIQTSTGYSANYFVLSDVNISFKKKFCEVLVIGFKDAETRQVQGAQPLYGKRFDWKADKFQFSNAEGAPALWQQIYNAMKLFPEFQDAQDV